MSKCACDFSVRLQGPAEAMAGVDVGGSLTVDVCVGGLLGKLWVGGWQVRSHRMGRLEPGILAWMV